MVLSLQAKYSFTAVVVDGIDQVDLQTLEGRAGKQRLKIHRRLGVPAQIVALLLACSDTNNSNFDYAVEWSPVPEPDYLR
jgi:hypothetical protein